jgi:hypothetical protein
VRYSLADVILTSLVAVHGLYPINTELDAEHAWSVNGKLWLRDFLPSRVPSARVSLFEYNSKTIFNASTIGILECAEDLLSRLKEMRTVKDQALLCITSLIISQMEPNRPLVFICHSLGGIIVKQVSFFYRVRVKTY